MATITAMRHDLSDFPHQLDLLLLTHFSRITFIQGKIEINRSISRIITTPWENAGQVLIPMCEGGSKMTCNGNPNSRKKQHPPIELDLPPSLLLLHAVKDQKNNQPKYSSSNPSPLMNEQRVPSEIFAVGQY